MFSLIYVCLANLPLDVKNEEVSEAFSKYGLIHRASVLNMDKYVGPLPDTACAIVTFYLKSSAQAAITDSGSIAIRKDESGTKRVKVCAKVARHKGHPIGSSSGNGSGVSGSKGSLQHRTLSLEKCLEIVNHFLGYCNWSTELKALSRYTKGEAQNTAPAPGGKVRVSMAATVLFTFMSSDRQTTCVRGRGIGTYASKTLYDATEKARKFAVSAARRNGFKKIALIVNVKENSVIVETLDGSSSLEEIREEFDEDPDVREGSDEEYDEDEDNDDDGNNNSSKDGYESLDKIDHF